jgi:hypothetical protein
MEAAQALGWEEIDTVSADDLDETERRAYAIADNRTAELAKWNQAKLAEALSSVTEDGDAMGEATGFDHQAIVDLVEQHLAEPKEIVEDEVPEVQEETVTKPGDLWVLGDHRVLCGDSTRADDVERLMGGGAACATVSDPPYGIGYSYDEHDDSDNSRNAELVAAAFKNGPKFIAWTPGLRNLARDVSRFGEAKVLVWFKKFAAAGNGLGGASVWEPILVVGRPPKANLNTDHIECITEREYLDGQSLRELHSCPKPVRLYSKIIESFTASGGGVFEPFCGSGTTLIAAEQLGRKCYGMEISPAYCDVIVRRWQKLTGQRAVNEATGELFPE